MTLKCRQCRQAGKFRTCRLAGIPKRGRQGGGTATPPLGGCRLPAAPGMRSPLLGQFSPKLAQTHLAGWRASPQEQGYPLWLASPRARDDRPAVDAPAPRPGARATAGGGRGLRGDEPPPLAGHLSRPGGARRSHLALVSRPEDRPACGHAGALVVLTVKGQGQLCIDCWRRWVRGDLAWPQNGTCPETCSSPRREPSA